MRGPSEAIEPTGGKSAWWRTSPFDARWYPFGIDWPLTAIRLKLADGKWIAETAWTNPQAPMS